MIRKPSAGRSAPFCRVRIWRSATWKGPAGPQDGCLESTQQAPCFPVREEFIPLLLRAAGFKAIGLENNHSSDLGQAARQATRRLLEQNGLTALTYEQSPQFIRLARPDRRHREPLHDTGPGQTGSGRPMRGSSAEASSGKEHFKPRGRLCSLGK